MKLSGFFRKKVGFNSEVIMGRLIIISMALALGLSYIYQRVLTFPPMSKNLGYILIIGAIFLIVYPFITWIVKKVKEYKVSHG